MNVAQYNDHGPADILVMAKRPDPAAGENEILVRLEAIGVTPFDCKLRAGSLRNYFTVPLPFIPGRDGVGCIVDKGSGVSTFSIGDLVAFRTNPAGQSVGAWIGS
jgi:NADPH:quinone reductase-like Zn-dependent oxidoreductase